jgi:hypothetical protein
MKGEKCRSISTYNENYNIWKNQDYFDETAMRFLLQYPDLLNDRNYDNDNNDNNNNDNDNDDYDYENNANCTVHEKIGLLFPSGYSCKLIIEEVPQFKNWSINKCDGYEELCID